MENTPSVGYPVHTEPLDIPTEGVLQAYEESVRVNAYWKEYAVKKPRVPEISGEAPFQKKYRPLQVKAMWILGQCFVSFIGELL
jgi:hypothetical protein